MTKIKVPYGKTYQEATLSDDIPVQVIDPACAAVTTTVETLIEQALDKPIGSPKLEDLLSSGDNKVGKVLIIVNDPTRPGPNKEMVRALLGRLKSANIQDSQIEFIIATGSHRAPTDEEIDTLVGKDVHGKYQIFIHDCKKNNVYLGKTKGGLPVYVDKIVAEAKFIIATGLVAPHKAAGFSGGRKSIVPGVAGLETLKIHHSLPIRPFEPALGWMEGNPFHEAALEAAKLVDVKFILNAVQDPHKQNIAVVAGELEKAHAEGVRICREHNTVVCKQHGDVVIASPGGSPRDCNLYQAQKALATAELFVQPGGKAKLILVAQAEDGIGPKLFQDWLIDGASPEEIVERFRKEGFDVGTNKAFEYARAMTKGEVIIVSDNVDGAQLEKMKLTWEPTLQKALDRVCSEERPQQVIVLPKAVNIIPRFEGK